MLVVAKIRQVNFCQTGFSMVELMVVVSVIGILMAMGLPSYQIWMENTKIRTATESVQSGLQKARVEAIKRNTPVQFALGTNSAWTISCVTAALCPDLTAGVIEARSQGDGSSTHITVAAVPGGATTIVFSELGLTPPALNPNPFTSLTVDSNAISSSDIRKLELRLNASGASRMCDPSVALTTPPDPRSCY